MANGPEILMIAKRDDARSESAAAELRDAVPKAEIILAKRGDPRPAIFDCWSGDYLISYLSPFIIPSATLARARHAAINFHPGPPAYPGIGCTNFALYNGEAEYGVTCHHMDATVDTGPVIAVRRFPVAPDDSVWTVTQRCYEEISTLFGEILALICAGEALPQSDEDWTRHPYRRSELNALCEVTADMPEDELRRRIRAVTFPGAPGAYVTLHGFRFDYHEGGGS